MAERPPRHRERREPLGQALRDQQAVERVTGVKASLREFVVRSVTRGKDAQGEVSLELEVESDDRSFRGRAVSTDIIEASALAYINAVNAIANRRDRPHEVVGRPGAGV